MRKTKIASLIILALLNLNAQAQNRDTVRQNSKKAFDSLNSNDATNSRYSGYSTPSNQISSGTSTITLKQLRTNGECYTGFNGAEFIVNNGANGVATYKQEITDFGCQAGRVGSVATSSTVPVSTITWKCLGENGGSSVNCSAKVVEPINGQCSSTYHNVTKIVSDGATGVTNWFNTINSAGCTTGTVSGTAKSATNPPSTITWKCLGSYGGSNANCSSFVVAPINGKCDADYTTGWFKDGVGDSIGTVPIDNILYDENRRKQTQEWIKKLNEDALIFWTNKVKSESCSTGIGGNFSSSSSTLPSTISWSCGGIYGGSSADCSLKIKLASCYNGNESDTVSWGNGCVSQSPYIPFLSKLESGESVILSNKASGYTGSVKLSCDNGLWSVSSSSCNQDSKTYTVSSEMSFPMWCTGSYPVTYSFKAVVTGNNIEVSTYGTLNKVTAWHPMCSMTHSGSTVSCRGYNVGGGYVEVKLNPTTGTMSATEITKPDCYTYDGSS